MSLGSFLGGVAGVVGGVVATIGAVQGATSSTDVGALKARALAGSASALDELRQLARSGNPLTAFAAQQAVSEVNARRAVGNAIGAAQPYINQAAHTATQVAAGAPYIAADIDPSRTPTVTWVLIGAGVLVLVLIARRR